jgi:hypothetical protein
MCSTAFGASFIGSHDSNGVANHALSGYTSGGRWLGRASSMIQPRPVCKRAYTKSDGAITGPTGTRSRHHVPSVIARFFHQAEWCRIAAWLYGNGTVKTARVHLCLQIWATVDTTVGLHFVGVRRQAMRKDHLPSLCLSPRSLIEGIGVWGGYWSRGDRLTL